MAVIFASLRTALKVLECIEQDASMCSSASSNVTVDDRNGLGDRNKLGNRNGLGNRNKLGDRNGLDNRNNLGDCNKLGDRKGLGDCNGLDDRKGLGHHDSTYARA